MNRRTLALALTTLLATTPACLFSMEPGTGQQNNPNTNNDNNANNTNNTSVTGGSNNPTNNLTNNATNNATNNLLGSACDLETDEIPCGGEYACCDGTCVDVSGDTLNCGSCGFECGEGQECSDGMCVAGDDDCAPAEALISPTNRDVAAFPRPLLVPAEDPTFACYLLSPGCPLSPEYRVADPEDAAYLAFYGTAPAPDDAADTINAVMVDERGNPLDNSVGTISNPGFELIGMRAIAVAGTAQLGALWRESDGALPKTQLNLYDLERFSRAFPGTALGTTTQPTVTLADSERITSFDVVQLPLPDDIEGYTDVRAVIFGVVENPVDANTDGVFRMFFTVVGRRGRTLEQINIPGTDQPFVVLSERVPIGAQANFSITQITLGESIVGVEVGEDGEEVPVLRTSAFVAISAPKSGLDPRGERTFVYNNFLLPTDEEFDGGDPKLERVYDTFRAFDRSWAPPPARYPSDAYMPVTLLQGAEDLGGVGLVSALTTSSDPGQQNRNNTSISLSLLSADATRDAHRVRGPDNIFGRQSYTFSALIEFAPWFETPGLLGWLEGTVTEGVVGPVRELRYSPVGGSEDEGPELGAQQVLVGLDESEWVEAYDTATGGRSYGVLMVTKLGADQPSQARFRAISSDGRPVCTLDD
jgi:hypothetical protein